MWPRHADAFLKDRRFPAGFGNNKHGLLGYCCFGFQF
jgi:hypothetical protein